jgi:hypothetical protein
VDLKVFNILGQELCRPIGQKYYPAGLHRFILNNKTNVFNGSGIYLVQLKSAHYQQTIKLIMLK